MMCGVLHPRIILPDLRYEDEVLENVLRHELMHYRRRDTLYKWFAVLTYAVQWFNPLVYLMRREVDRACELSCDEMLMRCMDRQARQSYGETLLSMAASAALPTGVVATTFATEKKNLKERLEQIMKFKPNRKRKVGTDYEIQTKPEKDPLFPAGTGTDDQLCSAHGTEKQRREQR